MELAKPQLAVEVAPAIPAAATSLKKIGINAVTMTRTKAELPTS